MSDSLCDVIVLTYNRLEITKQFFASLLSSMHLKIKIIVVDNASTDGTTEYLRELKEKLDDNIEVIYNKENIGFTRGVNLGFSFSTSPYVCLANNDLIFTEGWLDEIIRLFERYKSIGILNPNSNTLGMYHKEKGSIEDLAVDLKRKYAGIFTEMPFCSGFCMVMRRDIMDKNGGLSKVYVPMFFGDTDISMKAKEMGYLIGMAKGAYVWHKEHGSFKEGSEIDKIFKKNLKIFQGKWGKILRIAWVEDNYQDLLSDLKQAIILGRQSNYITAYIRNVDVIREDIFKSLDTVEHSGVSFKKFNSYFGLVWGIMIKKKKFDLIISKDKFLGFILGMIGQRTATCVDGILITNLKKRGRSGIIRELFLLLSGVFFIGLTGCTAMGDSISIKDSDMADNETEIVINAERKKSKQRLKDMYKGYKLISESGSPCLGKAVGSKKIEITYTPDVKETRTFITKGNSYAIYATTDSTFLEEKRYLRPIGKSNDFSEELSDGQQDGLMMERSQHLAHF